MLTVTVCIATYQRPKSLSRCLRALAQQTDKNFDVVVIDGEDRTYGSHGTYRTYDKKLSLQIIHDPRAHLAYIRDRLWREASGDIIAAIDDDVVVDSHWISAIKNSFNKNRKLGGVTGPTIIPENLLSKRDVFFFHTTTHWFWKRVASAYFWMFMNGKRFEIGKIYPSGAWSPGSNFLLSRQLKQPIEVDYLEACNFAIPRKILDEIGGYNLAYSKTSEWCEIDVAFRIRKKGYVLLFDPLISVEHQVSTAGVYARRVFPWHRIRNFLRFYGTSYFPHTLYGYIQFAGYFVFILIYYSYLNLRSQK